MISNTSPAFFENALPVLWVETLSPLNHHLLDYPATLSRDAILTTLKYSNIASWIVSENQAVQLAGTDTFVFLFSSTTAQWPHTCHVAKRIRERNINSVIVVGGYHPSALPDDLGSQTFDIVVQGEGDEAIIEVLTEALGRHSVRKAPGRVWRTKRITDLSQLPEPLHMSQDVRVSRLRGLMYPSPSRQFGVASLLLSRGCNARCSFCASHTIWGDQLITRSINSVDDEFECVSRTFGANAVVLVDQAFGEDIEWTRELCLRFRAREMATRTNWYCMAKTSLSRSLIVDMAVGGCTKIGFGVETADQDKRIDLKRQGADSLDDLNELFQKCNEVGILVKVYMMIGFPWETRDYLIGTTKRFLENLRANEVKITYFTPFPGTEDWEKNSKNLITTNWEYFDTETIPVVKNERIDPQTYGAIRRELVRSFYSSSAYAQTTARFLHNFPDYVQSWKEFANFLIGLGQLDRDEEWTHRIQVIR